MKNKINKKKLIILGGYGVGMIAASIAENFYNFEIKGFLNDKIKGKIGKFKKYNVLGSIKDKDFYLKEKNTYFFDAIVNYKKKEKYDVKIPESKLVSLIHPNSNFYKDSLKIEKNVIICSNVNISTDVKIEKGVKIMSNVFIGHNSIIKEKSFIASSASIGGNVIIYENAFVGLNSTIIENCKIGKNSILGAGSVLISNIKKGEVFVGNPASRLKKNSKK